MHRKGEVNKVCFDMHGKIHLNIYKYVFFFLVASLCLFKGAECSSNS